MEVMYMTYESLRSMFKDSYVDLCCVSSDNEVCVISRFKNPEGEYIKVRTAQHNNVLRINIFHEDGTIEEYFEH